MHIIERQKRHTERLFHGDKWWIIGVLMVYKYLYLKNIYNNNLYLDLSPFIATPPLTAIFRPKIRSPGQKVVYKSKLPDIVGKFEKKAACDKWYINGI